MGDDIDFFVRGGVKIFNIRNFRVIFYIDDIMGFLWGLCPLLSRASFTLSPGQGCSQRTQS